MSFPKDNGLRYKTSFKTGKFVPIAHQLVDDTTHAKETTGPEKLRPGQRDRTSD